MKVEITKAPNLLTNGFVKTTGGDGTLAVFPDTIVSLFDFYTDASTSGTGATDLYTCNIPAGQLSSNGDKIIFQFAGINDDTSLGKGTIFFGGTAIELLVNTFLISDIWDTAGYIVRVNATTVRACFKNNLNAIGPVCYYKEIAGLTLANAQELKLQAAAPTGLGTVVTAKSGYVYFQKSA